MKTIGWDYVYRDVRYLLAMLYVALFDNGWLGADGLIRQAVGIATLGVGQVIAHSRRSRGVLAVDDALKEAIQHRAPAATVRDLAVAEGMGTLLQDGVAKCLAGLQDSRDDRGNSVSLEKKIDKAGTGYFGLFDHPCRVVNAIGYNFGNFTWRHFLNGCADHGGQTPTRHPIQASRQRGDSILDKHRRT